MCAITTFQNCTLPEENIFAHFFFDFHTVSYLKLRICRLSVQKCVQLQLFKIAHWLSKIFLHIFSLIFTQLAIENCTFWDGVCNFMCNFNFSELHTGWEKYFCCIETMTICDFQLPKSEHVLIFDFHKPKLQGYYLLPFYICLNQRECFCTRFVSGQKALLHSQDEIMIVS